MDGVRVEGRLEGRRSVDDLLERRSSQSFTLPVVVFYEPSNEHYR